MQVEAIDERLLEAERDRSSFLVFIYEGDEADDVSWSVASYLLTDADLPAVFGWLREHLPVNCCWSLGVVVDPADPTVESDLSVSWIVGSDVLNTSRREPHEQRLAEEMMQRRHRVPML